MTEVKRRTQVERRGEARDLAEKLATDGTLDLDRLDVLIQEEKGIAEWAVNSGAKSKNAQYASNMAKAEANALDVVSNLNRVRRLFKAGKPKGAATLLTEISVTGSKVSKSNPKSQSSANVYLEYLAARDEGFQQWLADGMPAPASKPARRKTRRTTSSGSSNRPEDYQ